MVTLRDRFSFLGNRFCSFDKSQNNREGCKRMSVRRRFVLAGFGVILVVIIGSVLFWMQSGSSGGTGSKPVQRPVPTAPSAAPSSSFTVNRVQQIASDLSSGETGRVQAAVAMPSGQSVPPEFVDQLHGLRSLSIDPTSLHDNGDGTASAVFAVVDANGKSAKWQAIFVESGNVWKLASTSEGA